MTKRDRRSRDGSARDAGFRGQRLEELFRQELNSLLDGEVTDPRLENVRFTRVELTRDGSSARIWFVITSNATESPPEHAHSALDRAAGFMRGRLCDALPLKRIPELRFRHDPSLPADELGSVD